MFCCPRRRQKQKKLQKEVEVGNQQSSSPRKSVTDDEDQQQEVEVKDTSATTVSAPAEAPQEKPRKAPWWHRLFGQRTKNKHQTPKTEDVAEETNLPSSVTEKSDDTIEESEVGEAGVQEALTTPDTPVLTVTEQDVAKKTDLPFSVTKESDDSSEKSEDNEDVQKASSTPASSSDSSEESEDNEDVQEASSTPDTTITTKAEEEDLAEDTDSSSSSAEKSDDSSEESKDDKTGVQEINNVPIREPETSPSTSSGHGGSVQANNTGLLVPKIGHQFFSASRDELVCLGFPNLAQTCYMNSTLQGLLTLTSFVQEVHNQQKVWSSHPLSQIFRGFVEVGVCHFTIDKVEKEHVLTAFKRTVSDFNSEFKDNGQKDAHELLSSVLNKMRSLSLDLHTAAVNMGLTYTCPVDAHIGFRMLSTRTCKGCGLQSKREEDYTNLSLDLVPGGSVSRSLQEYLKARELEYRCECGAEESSQEWSFLTLPNVLILQLQRFSFTSFFTLKKVDSPVVLSKELVMNPESSMAEQTHYSLVSVVSHLGSTANSGHYICDGADRQQTPEDMTDRWLTYNDMRKRRLMSADDREEVAKKRL